MRKLIIGCLFITLVLAGCGQSGTVATPAVPTGTAAPATPTSAPPTPTTAPAPTSESGAPADILLTLEQSGGFAGISTSMTIDTVGLVRITDGRGGSGSPVELQLTPEQVSELRELLDSAELQDLDPEYLSRTCADCFNYTIAIERERGKGAQIIMTDDAAEKPAPLEELLRLLAEFKTGQ